MTKEIMIQYEIIRKSGATNMFDYYNVISIAKKFQFRELAKVTLDEYKNIIMNFSKYMKQFNIKQK